MNKRKTFSKNFRQIIESSLNLILNRYDQHPGYGYLDTKFDLLTQRDYFNTQRAEDILRSGQTIYSWIQGRGLESLAEHYQAGFGNPKCILRILQEVCDNLQKCRIRKRNLRLTACPGSHFFGKKRVSLHAVDSSVCNRK